MDETGPRGLSVDDRRRLRGAILANAEMSALERANAIAWADGYVRRNSSRWLLLGALVLGFAGAVVLSTPGVESVVIGVVLIAACFVNVYAFTVWYRISRWLQNNHT